MPRAANLCLSNGLTEADVEFPTLGESSVEPPNAYYLKVHAAFAKVLHLSGVSDYVGGVEWDAEMEETLSLFGKTDFAKDFASVLRSKPTLAY
jgi:hypothetical protein